MIEQFTFVVAVAIVGGAIFQALLCSAFLFVLRRQKRFELPIGEQHATAVLICVRGCDPTLRDTIRAVLDQDFDDYQVHVVVDHRTDDAWDLLQSLKDEYDLERRLEIHEMPSPRSDCGLKCQALVHGLSKLDAGTQYVALLDADVRPHQNWLKEMTGPLVDPSIGVSTGNQWFEPDDPASVGGLTRSLWNAGALLPTVFFQNPWAGSLAMRMDDVRKSDLAAIWRRSLVDDGPIREAIRNLGLKVHFSPSILMVNREQSKLPFVRRWIGRMLTWSRLYERTFFATVIHATISSMILLLTFGALIANVITADMNGTLISTGALLLSGMFSLLGWWLVRTGAAYSCALQGQSLAPVSVLSLIKMLLLISVAQFFYAIGCVQAIFSKQVRWREITYDVGNRGEFQMLNYQPISGQSTETSEVSI